MNTIQNNDTLNERLKIAMNANPLQKITMKNTNIIDAPTQTHTIEAITGESVAPVEPKVEEKVKGKKIFRIKKFVKFNKLMSELCSDEDASESSKIEVDGAKAKKISPFSKVNFSKLKDEEKDEEDKEDKQDGDGLLM